MKQPVSRTFRYYSSNWESFCVPRTADASTQELLWSSHRSRKTCATFNPELQMRKWTFGNSIDSRQSCQMTGQSRLPDHWATLYTIAYNASTLTSQNEPLRHNRFPIHIQQPGDRELLTFEILILNISPPAYLLALFLGFLPHGLHSRGSSGYFVCYPEMSFTSLSRPFSNCLSRIGNKETWPHTSSSPAPWESLSRRPRLLFACFFPSCADLRAPHHPHCPIGMLS